MSELRFVLVVMETTKEEGLIAQDLIRGTFDTRDQYRHTLIEMRNNAEEWRIMSDEIGAE